MKINGKYFKFSQDNITIVTINLASFNEIINIDIKNGLKLENFSVLLDAYLHEFFEGNTISGYANKIIQLYKDNKIINFISIYQ